MVVGVFFVVVVVVGGGVFFCGLVCALAKHPRGPFVGGRKQKHPRGALLSVGSFFLAVRFFLLLSELDPPQAGVRPSQAGAPRYSPGQGSTSPLLVLVLHTFPCRALYQSH